MSLDENLEKSPMDWLQQASVLTQQGKSAEAITILERVISLDPNFAEAHEKLAQLFTEIGEPQKALDHRYKVLEIEPNRGTSDHYFTLGNQFLQNQRIIEAKKCYEKAILLNSKLLEAYHNLAEILVFKNDLDGGIFNYQKALEIDPNYVYSLFGLGKALVKKSAWNEAIIPLRQGIEMTPNDPHIYYWLGSALWQIGQREEAVECYHKILTFNPGEWDIYQKIGEYYHQELRLDEAVEAYQKSIEIKPDAFLSYHQLGQILFRQKKWEEAAKIAHQAMELFPDLPWTYTQYANNLAELGKLEEVIPYHQKAAALRGWKECAERGYEFTRDWFSHNIPIWVEKLQSLKNLPHLNIVEIGSYQGMSACWFLDYLLTDENAKITCIEPGFQPQFDANISKTGNAHKVRKLEAFSQDVLGELEKNSYDLAYIDGCHLAESVLQDAILSWPLVKVNGLIIFDDYEWNDPETLTKTTKIGVDLFLELFKNQIEIVHKGYQVFVKKIASDVPNNTREIDRENLISAQAYQVLAEILEEQGDLKAAINHYRHVINNHTNFKLFYQLGKCLEEVGELEEARTFYQQSYTLNPDFWGSVYRLGNVFLAVEQWENAESFYRKAIMIRNDFFWSYYHLGTSLIQQKKWQESLDVYHQAIKLNPDFFGSYHQLGDSYLNLDQWEAASKAYQKAITLNPESAWSYHNLGRAFCQLEKYDEAILAYQQAIEREPNISWFYTNLGEAFCQQKRWDEAITAYENSLKIRPDCDWIYEILTRLLQQQGNLDKLIIFLEKLTESHPNYYWYYENLGDIYWQKKQEKQAISYWIKVLQNKPDYSLDIYDKIAKALEQLGYMDEAYPCAINKHLTQRVIEEFCHLPANWATNSRENPDLTHLPIYKAYPLNLFPTKMIAYPPLNPSNLWEESTLSVKSNGEMNWNYPHTIMVPEAFVVVIPKGYAWGDSITSAIITENRQLVTDVSTTGNAELIIGSQSLPPPKYVDGNVAFLSAKWGGTGYFHWFFDILLRIHLVYKSGFTIDKIDKFIVNTCEKSYQKETLNQLGIPSEKIIVSSDFPYIQAETLIIPSLPFQGIYKIASWVSNFFQQSFLPQNFNYYPPSKRIYISREPPYARRVKNNQEVIEFLSRFGFEIVLLENLSVQEQAIYLATSEIIIAPHGAGLTNLVFCHPKTKVIEIFSPLYAPPEYWLLCNAYSLEHYSLIGELSAQQTSQYDVGQDILINIEKLANLLNLAGIY